jgi:hypothetical protein
VTKALHLAVAVGIAVTTIAALRASDKTIHPVSFPSAHTHAVAPDGRFAVVNVDSDKEPYHALFLEDRQTNSWRKVLEYDRSVEVLWNPDSSAFAVNNYAGSNVGECLILFTKGKTAPVNVGDALLDRMASGEELSTLHISDHIYWTAVRWTSPGLLKVKVWGHTGVNPVRDFQYFHAYKIQR